MIDTLVICAHCGKRHRRPAGKPDAWFVTHAADVHSLIFARSRAERRRRWFAAYIEQLEGVIAERLAA